MTKDEETTVSKFQQEVYDIVRKLPGSKLVYNCQKHCIEKDILMTRYQNQQITHRNNQPTKGLVIEVDGVFHYPRNSMEPLGKNIIKFKALKSLGYHCGSLAVPYFDWAILEQKQRKHYLNTLVDNALKQ